MLSIETKLCSSYTSSSDPSQLKYCSGDESKASQQEQHKVDLSQEPNPSLIFHHQTPLSNFSLREYVFEARSKDIKTNWPFSQKTLQQCLKHGVKDILPPFQGLDSEKNPSLGRCEVGTLRSGSVKRAGDSSEEARTPDGQVLGEDLTDNFQFGHKHSRVRTDIISSCKSNGKNEGLAARNRVSQSEIELISTIRQSSTAAESNTLLEVSGKVEAAVADPRLSRKSDNLARVPGKKSRLVVKARGNTDRSSTENTGFNTSTVSEAMASKVCPVCKTFSSSSNTTLNAHIDQCLSGESTSKWSVDSKLPRHKNKPPKIRLMVDVYKTAKSCTLEELDRRNGTNWASVSSLPLETNKTSNKGQKHSVPVVQNKNTNEVGDVYIDSSGTKLRILSKLNDSPSRTKLSEDLGPKRSLKEGKGTKFHLTKKKRQHSQKQQKYLKVGPQSKKLSSRITNNCLVLESKERMPEAEGSTQIEAVNSMFSHLGALRQWVCSKRTGVARKCSSESSQEPLRGKLRVTSEFLDADDHAKVALAHKPWKQKSTYMFEKTVSASKYSERSANKLRKTQANDMIDQPPGAKEIGPSSSSARMSGSIIKSLPPPKRKACQFSKECSPLGDSQVSISSNITGDRMHGRRIKTAANPACHSEFPNAACDSRLKATKISNMVMNDTKGSTLRRRMSATGWSSSFKSKPNMMKKSSTLKKSRVNSMVDIDEGVAWNLKTSNRENQSDREEYITNSAGRKTCTEIRDERAADISSKGTGASRNPLPNYRSNNGNKANISSAGVNEAPRKAGDLSHRDGYQIHNIAHESSSHIATAQHTLHFCNSSRCEHYRLEMEGPLCEVAEIATGCQLNEREIFSLDGVSSSFRQPDVQAMEELDSLYGVGHSIFQVDPIPIPGPPGSFLPSPGRTGSEDFQGYSSLTTSRGQSSRDQCDVVDGDLSDSPISALSSVSNIMAGGSGVKSYENFKPAGSIGVHDNENSGFSSAQPSLDNVATIPQSTRVGIEKITYREGNCEFQKRAVDKVTLGYRNDEQPCCCQRKERTSENLALDCEEELLRKQVPASRGVAMLERQLGCESDSIPKNLEAMPEMVRKTNCSSSGSGKVFLPVIYAAADVASFKGSPDVGMEFSRHRESEPASQPGSNPVLRLMGKNLMVVNKDDPKSIFSGQADTPNSCSTLKYPTVPEVPSGFNHIGGENSFPHVELRGSVIFRQGTHGTIERCSEVESSSTSRSQIDARKMEILGQPSGGMLEHQFKSGSFAPLLEPFVYKGEYDLPSEENRFDKRLNAASSYAIENVPTCSDIQYKNADSVAKQREIIIIDDIPDKEAPSATNFMRRTENLRVTQDFSSGISVSAPHCVRHAETFPYNHPNDSFISSSSPVLHYTSSSAIRNEPAKSPVRWSYTSEGSGMFQMSPFAAPPSSSGHQQSPLPYYSRLS